MKMLLIGIIRLYQLCIRPLLGNAPMCRFAPSCSHYAIECLKHHGIIKGCWLSAKRLCKCGPWHPGGYDAPPSPFPSPRIPSSRKRKTQRREAEEREEKAEEKGHR